MGSGLQLFLLGRTQTLNINHNSKPFPFAQSLLLYKYLSYITLTMKDKKILEEIIRFREISKMDELLAALTDSIALLKERRSALITAAVTGQIALEDMTS